MFSFITIVFAPSHICFSTQLQSQYSTSLLCKPPMCHPLRESSVKIANSPRRSHRITDMKKLTNFLERLTSTSPSKSRRSRRSANPKLRKVYYDQTPTEGLSREALERFLRDNFPEFWRGIVKMDIKKVRNGRYGADVSY